MGKKQVASRSFRQLPGAARVHRLHPVFVAPDDSLESILGCQYRDWIDWIGDERVTDGVAAFFHLLIEPNFDRIKCKIDRPAVGADHCEIRVSLMLSLQERKLMAALRARKIVACRRHLKALGLLPPPQKASRL